MAVTIQKNEIRIALLQLHRELIDILKKYPNDYRLHEFNKEMELIANAIKSDFRDSRSKNSIRKALKGARKSICAAAQKSIRVKKINADLFFKNYFDGQPLENKTISDADYDLVIEVDSNKTIAWVFAPNRIEEVNHSDVMREVEKNFGKPCLRVLNKYQVMDEDVDSLSIKVTELPKYQLDVLPVIKPVVQKEDVQEVDEYIGAAIHDEELTVKMKNDQADRRIFGYIRQGHISEVIPDDILAFDSPEGNSTILTTVFEFEPALVKRSGFENRFKELRSVIACRPLIEIVDGEEKQFRAKIIDGYQIRKPTDDEVLKITGFPKEGVPLGKVRYGDNDIDCFYPFNPEKKKLEDTIYRSFFIVGTQHSGKTTSGKYWFQALTSYEKLPPEKRPAIIILDGEVGENSYKQFTPEESMKPETTKFLNKHNISPTFHKIYSISDEETRGDTTLSLQELKFEDLTLFVQNMEEKTENILKQKLKIAFAKLKTLGEEITFTRVRDIVLAEVRTDPLIYAQQRPAIGAALKAIEFDIFDQPNKTKLTTDLLCQAGKISVIDVNGLDIPRRRFVAVNLLQLLHRYKEKDEHLYPGIILVMDEAEQLFPINCSKSEKAHVDRIITKTKEIADNGRKRHFGQFICTHLSGSIDERVVGLAETIMAFRCSADEKWIRKEYGKNYVDIINSLKTGECMIKVKISEEDQKQILAKIYFPDVSLQT